MACVRGDERGLTQNDEQEAGHEDSGVRQIEQRQDEGVDHLRRSRTQVMGRPEGARRALRRLAELGSQRVVGGLRGRRAAREGRRTSPILPMAHRSLCGAQSACSLLVCAAQAIVEFRGPGLRCPSDAGHKNRGA